jgi:hypothetical protein
MTVETLLFLAWPPKAARGAGSHLLQCPGPGPPHGFLTSCPLMTSMCGPILSVFWAWRPASRTTWVCVLVWGNGRREDYIITVLHKVHIFTEYHSVCPLVGTGTLPPPISPASVPLPPEPKRGGGAHSPAGEGLGEFQFRRLEKKLRTLPTLCSIVYPNQEDVSSNPLRGLL